MHKVTRAAIWSGLVEPGFNVRRECATFAAFDIGFDPGSGRPVVRDNPGDLETDNCFLHDVRGRLHIFLRIRTRPIRPEAIAPIAPGLPPTQRDQVTSPSH